MRNLVSRLKKLEGVGGKANILYSYPSGSSPEEEENLRAIAENRYLSDGGDPFVTRVFVGVQEFGSKSPESKWFYSN